MLQRFALLLLACTLPTATTAQEADPPVVEEAAEEAEELVEEVDREDAVQQRLKELAQQLREAGENEQAERIRQMLGDVQRRQAERAELHGRLLAQFEQANPADWEAKPFVDPLAGLPREAVLAKLDDPDYATRESAERHLLADDTLEQTTLVELIRSAESDEQRHRLMRVAEHHVMRVLREARFGEQARDGQPINPLEPDTAAIGFSYAPVATDNNPHTQTPAVTVIATMPGFPGHAQLQVGDMVVAVSGQTAHLVRFHNDTRWISDRISRHGPGDTVVLTVARQGELLEIPVVAAQGRALNDMYTTNGLNAASRSQPYQDAWQSAYEQLAKGLAEPERLVPAQAD